MRRRVLRPVPIALVPVAEDNAAGFLYDLLKERTSAVSISHKVLPTFKEHVRFVASHSYFAWYVIKVGHERVGSIYLTFHNEIGVFVLKKHRRLGYGQTAIRAVMHKHPQRVFLANINPKNRHSAKMFKRLGFKLAQHTYVCIP